MPSRSIINGLWPRLNAKPDLFLVHRNIPIIPELYVAPGRAEWEHLYEQYPRLAVERHEQAVTFHCPVLRATPDQESAWARTLTARPRPDGLWYGWGVELRESSNWQRLVVRGHFVIDGNFYIGGKVHCVNNITSQDIETVTAHVVEFVDRMVSVLQPRTADLAIEPS